MPDQTNQDSVRVKFHYLKSGLYRVIHADGAWGGLTPDLQLFFSFFNTRPPIPKILGFEISEEGMLSKELPEIKESKDGLVREVEVGVVMSPENVEALIAFLQERLKAVHEIKKKFPTPQLEGQKNQ